MAYASDLVPRQKAAILMVMLGKEYSSKIYKYLSQDEIEQLTLSITNLDRVDSELSDRVLEEFHDITLAQKYVTEGGIEYARDVLVAAVGAEQADALLSRLTASLQVRPFDFVRRADSAQVFNFIQNEHPQTIARGPDPRLPAQGYAGPGHQAHRQDGYRFTGLYPRG